MYNSGKSWIGNERERDVAEVLMKGRKVGCSGGLYVVMNWWWRCCYNAFLLGLLVLLCFHDVLINVTLFSLVSASRVVCPSVLCHHCCRPPIRTLVYLSLLIACGGVIGTLQSICGCLWYDGWRIGLVL